MSGVARGEGGASVFVAASVLECASLSGGESGSDGNMTIKTDEAKRMLALNIVLNRSYR